MSNSMETQPSLKKGNGFTKILTLAECSLLVAVSFALSWIKFVPLPQGGSVAAIPMLGLIIIGVRRGPKWGFLSCFIYGMLQMLQEFYPPPTETLFNYILVIFLDYVLAFTIIGVAGFFKNQKTGVFPAIVLCYFLRFFVHFVSGILVWGVYAPEGQPVWLYSLLYNGIPRAIELVPSLIVAAFLYKSNLLKKGVAAKLT